MVCTQKGEEVGGLEWMVCTQEGEEVGGLEWMVCTQESGGKTTNLSQPRLCGKEVTWYAPLGMVTLYGREVYLNTKLQLG